MPEKILFTWSGGKDSAMALWELQRADRCIASLLTTLTAGYDRVSMHGVRTELLDRQARALSLPLEKVYIRQGAANEEYEARMADCLAAWSVRGVSAVAFGDIFLEDIRACREKNLAKAGMTALFPLWKQDTAELARRFVNLGFRAVITCVDSKHLDGAFAGRSYDEQFLADLPAAVDPCGENGEFHSFVYDGPNFRRPVAHRRGPVVLRDERFHFCDLTPVYSS